MPANESPKSCSFCGSSEGKVDMLIEGTSAFICFNCVEVCSQLALSAKKKTPTLNLPSHIKIPKPKEIKEHFDQYIIEQESAKVALAVAVCDHYKRVNYSTQIEQTTKLEKSNILLIGPTGTGKTHFARCIAEFLGVPFAIGDATTLTEAGYVGDDVENLLLRLLQAAQGDVKKAQTGIIFLDEVDKIACRASGRSTSKDVGGEGVQQALLKMLEGTIAHVPSKGGRKHPEGSVIPFDTTNVLFIASGAFVGLDEILHERTTQVSSAGFALPSPALTSLHPNLCPEDLIRFGLIPEFIGRFPVLASLQALSRDALRRIFSEVKNSLYEQYILQFSLDGVTLTISPEMIDKIVDEAVALKTGARGLRAVVEKLITPYKYNIDLFLESKTCIIDGPFVPPSSSIAV